MFQCAGYVRSGPRCKRSSKTDSIFCWQHGDELDQKYLEASIPKPIINVTYRTNDLLGQALQAGILDRILSFVDIPPETGKIFNIDTTIKFNFLLKKLKLLYPTIEKWNLSTKGDINILYSLLKQKATLTNPSLLQTLQKKVLYKEFYIAYINTVTLEQSADFLISIYKRKFFLQFLDFYPTFAIRLNNFLLDKYGQKTKEDPYRYNYNEGIIHPYRFIVSLYQLEDKILSHISPHTYNRDNRKFFENTYWQAEFTGYFSIIVDAIELYLSTHQISWKVKRLLNDLNYTCYNSITTTWPYTVWKFFPKNINATHWIVAYLHRIYLKSSRNFEIELDLTLPISSSDIKFFLWLNKILLENSNKIYKTDTSFVFKFYLFIRDKILVLKPSLWPKLSDTFNIKL